MPKGNIIFLNGTSSSGKTTLALALQEVLPEPYLHIALDQFRDGMPAKYRGLNSPEGTPGALGLNVVPVVNGAGPHTDIQFGDEIAGRNENPAAAQAFQDRLVILCGIDIGFCILTGPEGDAAFCVVSMRIRGCCDPPAPAFAQHGIPKPA